MSFVLYRVDDRMIHGQVVVGWGSAVHPDRIILCHDEISANQWEKDLYESSFSVPDCQICVFSLDELLNYYHSEEYQRERTILLVETPKDALKIFQAGIHFDILNIGGLHFRDKKKELNNYIYVDAEDVDCINKLQKLGVKLEGQTVPNAKKVDVGVLLEKKKVDF